MVAEQHRTAERMNADLLYYQQRGADAAALLMVRAYRAVVSAYTKGRDVSFPFRAQFMLMHKPLVDSMIIAYLLGADRIYKLIAPTTELSLFNVFNSSKAFLAKRMAMPTADLQQLAKTFDTPALLVLQKATARNEAALQSFVRNIHERNLHVREGKKVLAGGFQILGISPPGISDKQKHFQLETIYRTQTQMAYGAGQWEVEQDPDIDELIWGFEYVTTDDDRVRPTHAGLDGVKLPKGDLFWQHNTPPNGWNCRCQRIPLFESPEDGPIPPPEEFEGVKPGADKGFRAPPSQVFGLRFPSPPLPPKPPGIPPPVIPKPSLPRLKTPAKKASRKRPIKEVRAERIEELRAELRQAVNGGVLPLAIEFNASMPAKKAIEALEVYVATIKRLRKTYPGVDSIARGAPQWLQRLETVNSESFATGKGRAFGAWVDFQNKMKMAVKNRRPEHNTYARLRGNRSTSGTSYRDTFSHELGHSLQKQLQVRAATRLGVETRELSREWEELFDGYRGRSKRYAAYSRYRHDFITANVTEYAGYAEYEMFAESFGAYTHPSYGVAGSVRLPKKIEVYFEKLLNAKNPNLLMKATAEEVTDEVADKLHSEYFAARKKLHEARQAEYLAEVKRRSAAAAERIRDASGN